ncbi:MAG TPA: VWA domain-containing protein, partial [Thermomicrobiales bacterium]|nr:VWA domain-containing protein [Thermomicrobiales bacterium]
MAPHDPAAATVPTNRGDIMIPVAVIPLSFSSHWPLLLLLLIPPIAVIAWRSFAPEARHRRSLVVLRVLTLVSIVLALAGPLLARNANTTTTVFLVDQSISVASNGDTTGATWLHDALASADGSDQAAIVSFGGSASLTVPDRPANTIPSDWADAADPNQISPDFTNIESAVALARTLPVGGNRRIVIISDGAQNLGSVQTQAAQAAADGVPIDVLIVPGAANDDLRIDSLTLPAAIWHGEQPNVLVSVATVVPGPAALNLIIDGASVSTQTVNLPAGLSSWSFPLPVIDPGFHAIGVAVSGDPTMDLLTANNHAPAALIVRDAPRVLLVASAKSDVSPLAAALESGGAEITQVTPDHLPGQVSLLSAWDAFVLDNIPASDLQVEQIAALQEATRTLGKGLVVVGGTSSYGPGQYAGTRLEDMLPVTVKVTDGRERQRVALLLIVDHSGSMAYDPLSETSKVDMAKEAMRLAGTALADGDTIGVLEFNDTQHWAFPLTQIAGQKTRDDLNAAIAQIKATGGTEVYPALQVGLDAIRNVDADVRHVVLLSDGKSRSGTEDAFMKLVTEAGQDRTTVSTIAVGNDADTELMQKIAQAGGGRYHFTNKAEEIPAVTLQEAQ